MTQSFAPSVALVQSHVITNTTFGSFNEQFWRWIAPQKMQVIRFGIFVFDKDCTGGASIDLRVNGSTILQARIPSGAVPIGTMAVAAFTNPVIRPDDRVEFWGDADIIGGSFVSGAVMFDYVAMI